MTPPRQVPPWWEQQVGEQAEVGVSAEVGDSAEAASADPDEFEAGTPLGRSGGPPLIETPPPPVGEPPSVRPRPGLPTAIPPRVAAPTVSPPPGSPPVARPPSPALEPPWSTVGPPPLDATFPSSTPATTAGECPTVPTAVVEQAAPVRRSTPDPELLDAVSEILRPVATGFAAPRLTAAVRAALAELDALRDDPTPVAAADLVVNKLGSLVELSRESDGGPSGLGAAGRTVTWLSAATGVLIVAGVSAGSPSWLVGWMSGPWPLTPWALGVLAVLAQMGLATRTVVSARRRVRNEQALAAVDGDLASPVARLRIAMSSRAEPEDRAAERAAPRPAHPPAAPVVPAAAAPLVELTTTTIDAANEIRAALAQTAAQLAHITGLTAREADHTAFVEAGERPIVAAADRITAATDVLAGAAEALQESVRDMEAAMDRAHWLELVVDGLHHDHVHDSSGPGP